jgi:hypothetical protein
MLGDGNEDPGYRRDSSPIVIIGGLEECGRRLAVSAGTRLGFLLDGVRSCEFAGAL